MIPSINGSGFAREMRVRPFLPYPGLSNGHLQTILGNKRPRRFALRRELAERREFHPEQDVVVVASCHWQTQRKLHPTALIVHGLEGSAEASYVLGTADKAYARGFNVIRYNVRNCGGTEHLSTKLYHSGLTSDLRFAIDHLITVEGLKKIYLIGFSMGGNQILKLAGEYGDEHPRELLGLCAISPPLDLAACSRAISRPENRIYEYRFLRSLKAKIRRKADLFPEHYRASLVERVSTLWDFDEAMAPYYGFQSALDYYEQSSALYLLDRIQMPALIIHAEDDPFIPFAPFEDRRLAENEMIWLLATRNGGHVAFCGRPQPDEDCAWAENRAVEFGSLLAKSVET